jgi:hypothetical protein
MHRKIYTKQESFQGASLEFLFAAIWYALLLPNFFHGAQISFAYLIPLLAGLLPLAAAVQKIRSGLYYRRIHQRCRQTSPQRGTIIDCQRQSYQEQGTRGRVRTSYEYILIVEICDPATLQPVRIQSEPYAWPVYRVLASPDVDVYTDESGWHYFIDGFCYKKNRHEPDIFPGHPLSQAPAGNGSRFSQILTILILVLILLQALSAKFPFF